LKIKTPIQMETFNDGVLDVYEKDEQGEISLKIRGVRFANRVIGAKRLVAASQLKMDFSNLIRIPKIDSITTYDVIIMNGFQYKIMQIQHLYETNPPTSDLSIKKGQKCTSLGGD